MLAGHFCPSCAPDKPQSRPPARRSLSPLWLSGRRPLTVFIRLRSLIFPTSPFPVAVRYSSFGRSPLIDVRSHHRSPLTIRRLPLFWPWLASAPPHRLIPSSRSIRSLIVNRSQLTVVRSPLIGAPLTPAHRSLLGCCHSMWPSPTLLPFMSLAPYSLLRLHAPPFGLRH